MNKWFRYAIFKINLDPICNNFYNMTLLSKVTGFLLMVLLTCSESIANTVYVGVYDNSPKIENGQRGKPNGIFVDILEHVAKKEGWEIVYVSGTWSEGLRRLVNGGIDLMPDVAFSRERETRFDFNRIAVLSSWLQCYCRKNDTLNSLSSLDNKTVAVLKESIQEKACMEICRKVGINVNLVTCNDYNECIESVQSGRAYAVIVSRFYGYRQKFENALVPTSVIFNPTALYYASKKGENRELLNAIDKHLAKMMDNPGSDYYRSLSYWLNEKPYAFIPRVIILVAITGILLLLLGFALNITLGRMVFKRTKELEEKNRELTQALNNLKTAKDEAIKRERLYAIGQMASGIAHDFNNMLTPVTSGLDLIHSESSGCPESVKQNLELIRSAVQYGTEIIRRMQNFSRITISGDDRNMVDMNSTVKEVIKLVETGLKGNSQKNRGNVEIGFEPGENVLIFASLSSFYEIVLNLIINAFDAMPQGGRIKIITENRGEYVSLSVEDDGLGMTEEIRSKCLEPFFTTKGSNGTGIGLTMVNSIVKEHGGNMEIISSVGKGTRIILVFPGCINSKPGKKEENILAN